MRAIPTALADVLIFEPVVHGDARGSFMEAFNQRTFERLTESTEPFVQDNQSRSGQGVLRGLHYQVDPQAQGKLVRACAGEILDVAVDLRRGSATFGRWEAVVLSADNHRMLWVPPGFAHGFIVRSASAEVLYKVTAYYAPDCERCIRWDDQDLGIDWGLEGSPQVSDKDAAGDAFADADKFP